MKKAFLSALVQGTEAVLTEKGKAECFFLSPNKTFKIISIIHGCLAEVEPKIFVSMDLLNKA